LVLPMGVVALCGGRAAGSTYAAFRKKFGERRNRLSAVIALLSRRDSSESQSDQNISQSMVMNTVFAALSRVVLSGSEASSL